MTIDYFTRDGQGNDYIKKVQIKEYKTHEADNYICPICHRIKDKGIDIKDIVSGSFTDWAFLGDSMSDIADWTPEQINAVFAACKENPQHKYLFLTKRPEILCTLANAGALPKGDSFWWGSSVTGRSSKRFQGGLRHHTFISIEPLLEPLEAGLGSFGSAEWIILGAETGNRKGKVIPQREWVDNILEAAAITQIPVFMKDSMIPIVGEAAMRREFPWEVERK